MPFVDLVDKAVRFSWKPEKVRNRDEVIRRLRSECHLDPVFLNPVKSESAMQSIALPVLLAQMHGDYWEMRENAPWRTVLTTEERWEIARTMGFTREDRHVLHLVHRQAQIAKAASYIAATFAFTSRVVPMVASYQEVISAVLESTLEETPEYTAMKKAGMLVVTNPLGRYPGADKAEGALFTLFARKADRGDMVVYIDMPTPEMGRVLDKGGKPSQDDFIDMVASTAMGSNRMAFLVGGLETYFNYNTRFVGVANGDRKTVTV